MSSKADTKNMNQEKKCEFKPKLRFPEFWDAGEWTNRKFSEFITERNQPSDKKCVLFSLTIEDGITPKTERYERAFLVGDTENAYKKVLQNDFAYNPMNLRFGAIGRYAGENAVALSKYYNVFYCDKTVDSRFYEFYLKSYNMIVFYNKMAIGSLIEKTRVHFSSFLKFKIPFPTLREQQKIADCLSSISDRITLEAQKLDTLKVHKKGLMQQLFPAEGETLPKLRFPEFQDAGDWEEQKLGSLVEIFSGDAPSSYKLSSAYGCPYVKVEDMNNCSKYQSISREYADKSTKNLPTGSVIFPKRGAAIMGNKVRIAAVPFYIDSNMMALFPQKKSFLLPEFLYYLVLTQQLSKIADTSSIPQINNKHIIAYTVKIPSPPEQQKIADCLSSLDELITAQAQAIDTLKNHKKGLMQQLFPSVEEVKA